MKQSDIDAHRDTPIADQLLRIDGKDKPSHTGKTLPVISPIDGQVLCTLALADANDRSAARLSLDAPLRHWRTGDTVLARDWLAAELEQLAPLAAQLGLSGWLEPLHRLLREGNQAMRWLAAHRAGTPVAALVAQAAQALEQREVQLTAGLATDQSGVLG